MKGLVGAVPEVTGAGAFGFFAEALPALVVLVLVLVLVLAIGVALAVGGVLALAIAGT